MPVIGARGRPELASDPRKLPRGARIISGWLWAVGMIVLLAVGCGAADESSQATETSSGTRPIYTSARPAPPTIEPSDSEPPSDYQEVDQAVQGLITRNATWQAPPSLQVNKTETVALAIGDVQSLQDKITDAVPTVSPRQPRAIEIGSRVRARLMVSGQDGTVAPLEPINESIGEQTSILFSWQVTPLRPGELILSAHIEFPLTDEHVTTQIVPLHIPVMRAEPVKQPWSHTFQDLIKNYWAQLTAAGAAVLGAARLGWGWYNRRRNIPAASAAVEGPTFGGTDGTAGQAGATGEPGSTGTTDGAGGVGGAGNTGGTGVERR